MSENKYIIYTVKDYFEAPKTKWDSWSITDDITSICKLLEKDGHYNERLSGDQLVKVFLDIEVEALKIERIQEVIIEIFKNKLNLCVDLKDIKYTFNDKKYKDGIKLESYHITLPKYYAINGALRNLSDEFIKYDIKIDTTVYGGHWFRLPNQTSFKKSEKKYKHFIQNGKIKDFVVQFIDKSHSKNITKLLEALKPLPKILKNKPNPEVVDKSQLDQLLDGLTVDFLEDYGNWFSLGALLYNLDENLLDKFDSVSSIAPNYKVGCCEQLWKGLRKNQYTIASLHYWVKNCNAEYYSTLSFTTEVKNEEAIVETIQISKDYLTKQLTNGALEIDDDIVKYCDDLFNTDCKSLNIKSPYGTSKTQLVKLIIQKYNPKRILWLSFRQTLSDDIHHHFKELGFQHYLDGKLDSDRLIIQVESLMKIRKFELLDWIDNECFQETHKYDLIMLDEVESLLRQFNSPSTFSKDANTRDTFEYLEELVKKSNKVISLDGDLNNRSYQFIKQFGEGIYLENLTTKNNKVITVTEDAVSYKKKICSALRKKQKIVICSLSTEKARWYKEMIESDFPNLKVIYYTGSSDCKIKKSDFKDVNQSWSGYDVVIYTPTIEAGVSFEVINHFDKIFGIINANSCCQQSFFQMLSRVRNPKSNQILILNNGIFNPERSNTKVHFFKFEEVKQYYIEARKNLKIIYKDGKSTLGLDNYVINSIYNKVEDLNKNNVVWLTYFKKLGEKKGYTINISDNEKKSIEDDDFKLTTDIILEANDIDDSTYDILLNRQKGKDTSESENIEIAKKTLEKQIGLKLNKQLVDAFYQNTHTIKNFTYLVDSKNFKDTNDSFADEKKVKLELINELLQTANINIFSEDDCYICDPFIDAIKGLKIFDESSQILFSCQPDNNIRADGKKMMEFLNDILENYNLTFNIHYNGKRVKENRRFVLNQLNNITEIVYYQKLRNIISDTNNHIQKPDKLIYKKQFKYFDLE
jgi:hypothetical protein